MNEIEISARRSGKSSRIIQEFLDNPEESYIVVKNQNLKHPMLNLFNEKCKYEHQRKYQDHILTVDNVVELVNEELSSFTSINFLIDEYLFFNNVQKAKLKCLIRDPVLRWNIRIKTTSNMLYSKELLELTLAIKESSDPDLILRNLDVDIADEIQMYYWNNFLTDSSFKIRSGFNWKDNLPCDVTRMDTLGEWIQLTKYGDNYDKQRNVRLNW